MPLNRRHFLFGSLAAPLLAAKNNAPAKRPNFVFIEACDIGAFALGCYGNQEIRTPNLDRLTQTGVRFSNAFAASPVAEGGIAKDLANILSAAGYNCGSAADFIDAQSTAKPFLLTIAWPSPPKVGVPEKNTALYGSVNFETIGREAASPQQIASIRSYAAGLTTLDEQIGALLAKLQQKQLGDSTLMLFTSTNGYALGQHGLWGDGGAGQQVSMYDEVVHVPLIWSCPALFPPQVVPTAVVGAVDLLPTLSDLAGAAAPAQGRSYLPLVSGKPFPKKQTWPGVAFARLRDTAMVRDDRYKLVLRDQGKGPNELYDIAADPHETVNQYDNQQFLTVRERLRGELRGA